MLSEDKTKCGSDMPVYKLLPNMLTMLALCAGLSAIKFTFLGKWEIAVVFIFFAVILDGFDGKIARLFSSESYFGAQLDSLADLVNFGVAPSLLVYFWYLHFIPIFGWLIVTGYVLCVIIRLARFNEDSLHGRLNNEKSMSDRGVGYFSGIPSPAGAMLLLLPLLLSFIIDIQVSEDNVNTLENWYMQKPIIMIYTVIISFLTVSRIPTLSFKNLRVPKSMVSLLMCVVGIVCIFLFTELWITMFFMTVIYLLLIPVGLVLFFVYDKK